MEKEGTCDWIIWHIYILLTLQVNKKSRHRMLSAYVYTVANIHI